MPLTKKKKSKIMRAPTPLANSQFTKLTCFVKNIKIKAQKYSFP